MLVLFVSGFPACGKSEVSRLLVDKFTRLSRYLPITVNLLEMSTLVHELLARDKQRFGTDSNSTRTLYSPLHTLLWKRIAMSHISVVSGVREPFLLHPLLRRDNVFIHSAFLEVNSAIRKSRYGLRNDRSLIFEEAEKRAEELGLFELRSRSSIIYSCDANESAENVASRIYKDVMVCGV